MVHLQPETVIVVLMTAVSMLFAYALVSTWCLVFYVKRYDSLANNYSVVANDMVDTLKEVATTTSSLIETIDETCTLSKKNKHDIVHKLGEMEHRMTETIHLNSQLMSTLMQHGNVHIFNANSDSGNVAQGGSASQDIK